MKRMSSELPWEAKLQQDDRSQKFIGAVKAGNVSRAEKLLHAGADVNFQDLAAAGGPSLRGTQEPPSLFSFFSVSS